MQTQILPPNKENIALAAKLLQNGEIVGIPTETVYGLAASALNGEAVKKIFSAKGRPQDNPLISHISSMDMLPMIAQNIPSACYTLANAFWPGPLTMVLPRSADVADEVCAGLDTAAVRMPSHKAALDIIAAAGVPLAAPSANLSGSPSPTTARHVMDDMDGRIPLIIDGGACTVGVESTVISLCTQAPLLLRPGHITKEQLEAALGCEVLLSQAVLHMLPQGAQAPSPGMKYKHYAPKAEVILIKGSLNAYNKYVNAHAQSGTYRLCYLGEENLSAVPCVTYGHENSSDEQANRLFSALRELDAKNAKTVYARCPEESGEFMAVYNRILRSAAFNIVEV
ncbi:MAG: L-threonylcarbamoyladenylate synthase [Oscillospiraceae bacterium]